MKTSTDITMDKISGGAFFNSLRRNNKKIREDRARSLAEDTEMAYRREIEDITHDIKRLQRTQEAMLDLSPTETTGLTHPDEPVLSDLPESFLKRRIGPDNQYQNYTSNELYDMARENIIHIMYI